MSAIVLLTALFAAGLALVHLFSGRLGFLDVTPLSVWLSIAGGRFWAFILGTAAYAATLLIAF